MRLHGAAGRRALHHERRLLLGQLLRRFVLRRGRLLLLRSLLPAAEYPMLRVQLLRAERHVLRGGWRLWHLLPRTALRLLHRHPVRALRPRLPTGPALLGDGRMHLRRDHVPRRLLFRRAGQSRDMRAEDSRAALPLHSAELPHRVLRWNRLPHAAQHAVLRNGWGDVRHLHGTGAVHRRPLLYAGMRQ
jgi:hypothetical protein